MGVGGPKGSGSVTASLGGGTGAHGRGGYGFTSTGKVGFRSKAGFTSSFRGPAPTGPFGFTRAENIAASKAQDRASAENANRGGAPNWLTSGQIRLDQDVGPVRAPLDGTGLSSDSVAQPLDAIAEAEARADARRRAGGRDQLTSGGDVGFEREDEELGVT